MTLRIATFNLENLDDVPNAVPTLADRAAIMRPQLLRVNADILCLQEVHSQGPSDARTLSALDTLIAGTQYASYHRSHTTTLDGRLYDSRNLVVLSRFAVLETESIRDSAGPRPSYQLATAVPPDPAADPLRWERPIHRTLLDLGGGRSLHLFNLHLKSKLPTSIPGQKIDNFPWRTISAWAEGSFVSAMKRMSQAVQTRFQIDSIFDNEGIDSWIAVCGDFNADIGEVPVQAIRGHVEETGNPEHGPRVLVPCENNVPESSRFSLLHLGHGAMLDHILVSRGLLGSFIGAEIHNEVLPDESGAFRTDAKFPESDHAPVVAEFAVA